ncbi:MAG: hypothetical protein GY811_10745 [Myxococcales bacterium]|nr:hypothetical protein [Myxococcales bacterium]
MDGIEIESSDGLIWMLRYPATFRVGDLAQLFADVRQRNPERRKHGVLVDMSTVSPLSITAADRSKSAEIFKEHAE